MILTPRSGMVILSQWDEAVASDASLYLVLWHTGGNYYNNQEHQCTYEDATISLLKFCITWAQKNVLLTAHHGVLA